MNTRSIVLANFGGPRNKKEVASFLSCLLTDPLITRTFLPKKLHHFFFNFIAKTRTKKVCLQYEQIGGCSPIFTLTELLSHILYHLMKCPVITFHRYLPSTHDKTLTLIRRTCSQRKIIVVPLFPHFTYSVTGSIATFFSQHLSQSILSQISWIKSFGDHSEFINAMHILIQTYMNKHFLNSKDFGLIFSAHGLPKTHIKKGDPYYDDCLTSFKKLQERLSPLPCELAFQSKLGPLPWTQPYTKSICSHIKNIMPQQKNIGIVPFGFLSDHIETLFEIEEYYLPLLRSQNKQAFRLPALNLSPYWISRLIKIINSAQLYPLEDLL